MHLLSLLLAVSSGRCQENPKHLSQSVKGFIRRSYGYHGSICLNLLTVSSECAHFLDSASTRQVCSKDYPLHILMVLAFEHCQPRYFTCRLPAENGIVRKCTYHPFFQNRLTEKCRVPPLPCSLFYAESHRPFSSTASPSIY